ncbi:MAG: ABC transporter permease, partial [Owenweeksia sp.]
MKLLKIEWLKLKGHPFFWIGLGLYALCMILLVTKAGSIEWQTSDPSNPEGGQKLLNFGEAGFYKLPYIWQNVTYMAGFFKFIPAFLLIFFVSNEFQYKTYRQNVIDGLSIGKFYLSKLMSALLFALLSLLIIGITAWIIAATNNSGASAADFLENSDYLIAYFAEVFFLMVMALFLTFLFKRSTITVIIILLYYFIVEPIAGWAIGEPVSNYLPTRPSRELI